MLSSVSNRFRILPRLKLILKEGLLSEKESQALLILLTLMPLKKLCELEKNLAVR